MLCQVLRPQNKMPLDYARGVHPFELEREEISMPEEFRKRQETVKWSLEFITFRVGEKKWKMMNVPRPPPPQIPALFGGFLSFPKYLSTLPPHFDFILGVGPNILFCGRNSAVFSSQQSSLMHEHPVFLSASQIHVHVHGQQHGRVFSPHRWVALLEGSGHHTYSWRKWRAG